MSYSGDEHDTQLPEVLIKESLTVPGLGEGHRVAVQRQKIPFLLGTFSPHVSALRLQQSILTMVEEACSGHSVAWWQVAAAWAAEPPLNHPALRASRWIAITILQARHKIIGLVRGEHLSNVFNKN